LISNVIFKLNVWWGMDNNQEEINYIGLERDVDCLVVRGVSIYRDGRVWFKRLNKILNNKKCDEKTKVICTWIQSISKLTQVESKN